MSVGQLPALSPLSERAWQEQVTQLAEMLGWDWAHWRAARTVHGWRTPVSGTLGEGFPDLLLIHEADRRMLLAELKSDLGRLTAPQRYVHACLQAAGLSVHTWRPRDWDQVVAALQAPSARPRSSRAGPIAGRGQPWRGYQPGSDPSPFSGAAAGRFSTDQSRSARDDTNR